MKFHATSWEKSDSRHFQEKSGSPKKGGKDPNAPNMDPFDIYSKISNFFLQMLLNDEASCLLTFGENYMSGKNPSIYFFCFDF